MQELILISSVQEEEEMYLNITYILYSINVYKCFQQRNNNNSKHLYNIYNVLAAVLSVLRILTLQQTVQLNR